MVGTTASNKRDLRLPPLEVGDDDAHVWEGRELRARPRRERRPELDARDRVAAAGEGQGRLACPAADLEDAGRRRKARERREVVEDSLLWARQFVYFGYAVECVARGVRLTGCFILESRGLRRVARGAQAEALEQPGTLSGSISRP